MTGGEQVYFFTGTPETVVARDGQMIGIYADGREEVGSPIGVTPASIAAAPAPAAPSLEDPVTLIWRTRAAGRDGERSRGPVHIIADRGVLQQTLCGTQMGRYLATTTVRATAGEATCRACIHDHLAGTRRAFKSR